MDKLNYYSCQTLLSKMDVNGKKPEIFLCDGGRSIGKTTDFNRLLFNRFLKQGKKFILLYRFQYEIADSAEKFFPTIRELFFPEYDLTTCLLGKGKYAELYVTGNGIEKECCGYALSLNSADYVKKYSQKFYDADCILFDEFQSETNTYTADEIKKFISLHISIARAPHQPVRYVPVYLISNSITILNPYYTALGITKRITGNERFIRGNGWVLERCGKTAIADMQKESSFLQAFSDNDYLNYISGSKYLNDNETFIENMKIDNAIYYCTVISGNKEYGVRLIQNGLIYVNDSVDKHSKIKVSATYTDMTETYISKKVYDGLILNLRKKFDSGMFRFRDLESKQAILDLLQITM